MENMHKLHHTASETDKGSDVLEIKPRFRSKTSGDYKPSKYSELVDGNTQTKSS